MFAVVFEVLPAPGRKDEYLALAGGLRPILESIDGFLDNERFFSMTRPGWLLSLSTWRDEKSVIRWRTQEKHHETQSLGRGGVFAGYHLRVCEIAADTDPPPGLSMTGQRFDETETGAAKYLGLTTMSSPAAPADPDLDTNAAGLVEHDTFESLTTPGKTIFLTGWKDAAAAKAWCSQAPSGVAAPRHRSMRVIRDYTLLDRREAPQYHPPPPAEPAARHAVTDPRRAP